MEIRSDIILNFQWDYLHTFGNTARDVVMYNGLGWIAATNYYGFPLPVIESSIDSELK